MEISVSYKTPVGPFLTRELAVAACKAEGQDPSQSITVNVSPTDVAVEHAYGSSFRLSQPIRVF